MNFKTTFTPYSQQQLEQISWVDFKAANSMLSNNNKLTPNTSNSCRFVLSLKTHTNVHKCLAQS
jgi:hypothetical protein